jgi:predicted alpha/beta superfamily hydrolase
MKYPTLFIIIAVTVLACQPKQEPTASNKISIGTIDSLYSEALQEQRHVWVYVPENIGNGAVYGKSTYPVLYLLDGDAHFLSVVGMIHQLSTINGNTISPEMIVVGIVNTDRTRDLTPTHVASVDGDTTFSKTSGGAEQFTKYIQDELIPYIDQHYPTTPHRTLVGHSLGGLFAVNTLLYHPDLFANYLAIDPSLWWDNQRLLKEAETILTENRYDKKSLYVAIANTMKDGMQLSDLKDDTTKFTEHIRSILQFSETAKAKTNNGLNVEWKYYAEDDHGSVPLIAEYDALRFLYSWYKLDDLSKYFDPASKATPEEVVTVITNHYKNVSDHLGYTVLPQESFVNGLGYAFMGNKKDIAFALFQLNIDNYPKSSNVYDSMGDYYAAQQDTVHAIENFAKALTLADAPHTKAKLKAMKGEK